MEHRKGMDRYDFFPCEWRDERESFRSTKEEREGRKEGKGNHRIRI